MYTLIKNNVVSIIEQLKRTHLQPCDEVNELFGKLVMLALDPQNGIRELLQLSGQGLALLVKHLPKEGRRKLTYIGSGPLPLTAICYERQGLFSEVIGIDADQEALAASRQVCSKLGSGVSFLHADATKVNYNDFSLIFGAALVGMTNDEKQQILQKIKHTARPGTLVAVRSAYGSRELLYSKHERTVVRHRRSISLRISVPTARLKGTFVRGAMRIWRNT